MLIAIIFHTYTMLTFVHANTEYRISSFERPRRLFNFGTLGAAFIRGWRLLEGDVYTRAVFISKI